MSRASFEADQLALDSLDELGPTNHRRLDSHRIVDFVSGQIVRGVPQQLDAVQAFSQRLVQEYGYSRDQCQTWPQFCIRTSEHGREDHRVDIAVFRNSEKTADNLYMVVECKQKNQLDGSEQLKLCMGLTSAQIGVWFNGKEHLYLHKALDSQGNVTYKHLADIPRAGHRVEEASRLRRRELRKPTDLRALFRDIRNHLAGMTTGITRDEALARELISLLFCKIYDEINTPPDKEVTFSAGIDETAAEVKKRLDGLFEQRVKKDYSDVFDSAEHLSLDPESVVYVVGRLQDYCLMEADRDAIGGAFEAFIGPALRGSEGQFFTPRNVVKMMIDILDPEPGEYVIDPACGSGGFLIVALERIWQKLDEVAVQRDWSPEWLARQKAEYATQYLRGIEKDSFLAKVSKAYMAVVGDGRGGVFCDNSLKPQSKWHEKTKAAVGLGQFDVVVTNPPFGSKIQVRGQETLSQFVLGRVWKRDRQSAGWRVRDRLRQKQPPQVLFIERCLQLLRPGGRLGIILPESIFGNPSHGYIVEFLRQHTKILGLVSMPEELFQPYTHAKTCVLFAEKTEAREQEYPIFMGIAKWCGHNSRGNSIPYDDVPSIAIRYREFKANHQLPYERYGFVQKHSKIENNILIPKYYDPDIVNQLNSLRATHDLVAVRDLTEAHAISIATGVEVGRLSYGTGAIPFIRTSDIANWELKIDPKHAVSEDIYEQYSGRHKVREHDILMVRDGTYLVGTSCMLTECDTRMLLQSHILRIRVLKPQIVSPFLLLALLNTPIVKRQIRAKQFTQDIIDTLGNRIMELALPIPKERAIRREIIEQTRTIVEQRAELRQKAQQLVLQVAATGEPASEGPNLMS